MTPGSLLPILLLLFGFFSINQTSSHRLSKLELKADVSSRLFSTVAKAEAVNQNTVRKNLICRLDLHPDAFITKLVIEVGGTNYTSHIERRKRKRENKREPAGSNSQRQTIDTAPGDEPGDVRENYFTIRKREGSLQRFKASASVGPKESAIFYLYYQQVLKRTKSRYSASIYFPPSLRVRHLDINLMVTEAEPLSSGQLVAVPGYSTPSEALDVGAAAVLQEPSSNFAIITYRSSDDPSFNGSLRVRGSEDAPQLTYSYDVRRAADGGELQVSGKTFVLFFAPDTLPSLPKHTVFVLDISGSMLESNKLGHLKDAMEAILRDFHQDDSFQIIKFSTDVRSLGVYKAVGRELEQGIQKVKRLDAYGATNINDALLTALKHINAYDGDQETRQVFFLTDGNPTVKVRDTDVIRRNVREANTRRYPIFALAFGPDAELRFLKGIGSDNNGLARRISDKGTAGEQIKNFFDEVSNPLLNDVSVKFPENQVDSTSLVESDSTTFYKGDEIVASGKLLSEDGDFTPEVSGVGRDGPLQLRVSRKHKSAPIPPNPDLQKTWAYLAVQDLLSSNEVIEDDNLRHEMRARALHIALMNGFVTRHTILGMTPQLSDPGYYPPLPNANGSPIHPHRDGSGGFQPHTAGDITLLSKEELAATLPSGLRASLGAPVNRRFSFVDNDPHFVVQVPGLSLPLCFDVHGKHGEVLSVIKDSKSGIVVTGEVTSAASREKATYFTKMFIAFGAVNITVTPDTVKVECDFSHMNRLSRSRHVTVNERSRRRRHNRRNRRNRRHRRYKRHIDDTVFPGEEDTLIEDDLEEFLHEDMGEYDSEMEEDFDSVPDTSSIASDVHYSRSISPMMRRSTAEIYRNYSHNNHHNLDSLGGELNENCGREISWKEISGKRFGDVMLHVHRKRKLNVLVGDLEVHFTVTRSKNRFGQHFLGFYVEEQNVLSPLSAGIIGQFAFKSVTLKTPYRFSHRNKTTEERRSEVDLIVLHVGEDGGGGARISEVRATIKRRRSVVHRGRVPCLHVSKQGRGLLTSPPEAYVLPCLRC